jgi:hypothetical protein
MKARTMRGRALVAGAVVATSCVTGLTAAHAQSTTTVTHLSASDYPDEEAHFMLEPATMERAGTVVVRGTDCADSQGTFGQVFVRVTSEGGPIVEASTLAQPDGTWSVSLILPNALGPGEYPVVARCDQLPSWGDEQGFDYGVHTLRVTGPANPHGRPDHPNVTRPRAPRGQAPEPVTVKPHYTG